MIFESFMGTRVTGTTMELYHYNTDIALYVNRDSFVYHTVSGVRYGHVESRVYWVFIVMNGQTLWIISGDYVDAWITNNGG